MLDVFITGTGKNSGKTFVTAGLAATMQSLGYSTSVYLPVQTGAIIKDGYIQSPELVFVKNMDESVKTYCSYLFKNPDLPIIAAAKENQIIEKEVIVEDYQSIKNRFECMLVNGSSGVAAPLGPDFLEIGLVKALKLPLVLTISPISSSVSDIIAMINHTASQKVDLRGVILNDVPLQTQDESIKNLPKIISRYTGTRVLGVVPHIENVHSLNPNDLISYILSGVNLENVFNIKIAKLSL